MHARVDASVEVLSSSISFPGNFCCQMPMLTGLYYQPIFPRRSSSVVEHGAKLHST
jgi:hypothetical protein